MPQFDESTLTIEDVDGSLDIHWLCNMGFGMLTVAEDSSTKIYIADEYMGRDFAKKVLCKLVDDYFDGNTMNL